MSLTPELTQIRDAYRTVLHDPAVANNALRVFRSAIDPQQRRNGYSMPEAAEMIAAVNVLNKLDCYA
jgi:hypothetical protein